MKIFLCLMLVAVYGLTACKSDQTRVASSTIQANQSVENHSERLEQQSKTIATRFLPPKGYKRQSLPKSSFQYYLRNLPLKPAGASVRYFNGNIKDNPGIYSAVVDMPIGKKDLHQCADAVMRLRAEYLWHQKRYADIHFNFTNGFRVDYSKWMEGHRMRVVGNKTNWIKKTTPSNTYDDFWKFMELIFTYAGTASLEKELTTISPSQAEIGDILIQGGFPGHAVIIVDKVVDQNSGRAMYLLAQSYMPAQELQILTNPSFSGNSSWYNFETGDQIETPEWTFSKKDFKRFNHYSPR